MDPNSLFSVSGKSVAITGGAGVLCGAMAKGLASAGAKVAILDFDADRSQTLCDEITATSATLPAPFAPHLAALAAGIREPAIFQRTPNPTTCSGGL